MRRGFELTAFIARDMPKAVISVRDRILGPRGFPPPFPTLLMMTANLEQQKNARADHALTCDAWRMHWDTHDRTERRHQRASYDRIMPSQHEVTVQQQRIYAAAQQRENAHWCVVSDSGRADHGIEGLELTSQATGQAGDHAYHPGTGQAHAAFLLEPALPPLQGEGRGAPDHGYSA